MKSSIQKKINYFSYLNRETHIRHHHYDEELKQYYYIKYGDIIGAKKAGHDMFTSTLTGKLSDDKLRHHQYLFVSSTTLATRFAIQGGMQEEEAYNTSDLFIQELDTCNDIETIIDLQEKMMVTFAEGVRKVQRNHIQSLPILKTIQYIENHLHETIRIRDISTNINYSEKYLSKIFKDEMDQTIQEYIQYKKIQVAKNMLRSKEFSILEVSDTLAFSSQSYFSKIFKQEVNMTPRQFLLSTNENAISR